ncbi:uroporphyrinogen-III C-methyltransferase [Bacillus sp. AFS041924]|uniref:uroporphyrinogen-III C-methyltransferase n=1 Tax=Bacillus sp. AFS041924 TaxID=2033503 RepID=UPI000BFE0B99|nr:uroporphyrinogen-III C-methyltransferase [Bacillus sp. AFS041924]PGS50646.1 uroporphyrinogen-III C-methyltransferase [Bacillus sp. AFS041924]
MIKKDGFISFVGAGPGDLGLITEKGMNCIREAEVILYDRLANPRLLREATGNCEFIYCGKLPDRHTMRQEMINQTLVNYAKEGKYVVRLKGGDPSVFGRVGEEAEEASKHNIPFEIVPGITSSIAAAAYAGIPVTHREYSTSFTLRTGHKCLENEDLKELNCSDQLGDTLAYYMGVNNLPKICKHLIQNGKSKETPVAVIQWGTIGKQKVVEGTIETILSNIEKEKITNPAMTIIGDVVKLRSKLTWFDKKKYFGRKILLAKATTTVEKNGLEAYLTENGAEVYAFPTLKLVELPIKHDQLDNALSHERIVFNTPESVKLFFSNMYKSKYDVRKLPNRIEYISSKSCKVLEKYGIFAEKFTDNELATVFVGSQNKVIQTAHNSKFLATHNIIADSRFDVINQRMLEETSWESIIFPNRSSVDWFLKELQATNKNYLMNLPFAYIGESVKEYAIKCGFTNVDEDLQKELMLGDWKCGNV